MQTFFASHTLQRHFVYILFYLIFNIVLEFFVFRSVFQMESRHDHRSISQAKAKNQNTNKIKAVRFWQSVTV